MLMSIRKFLWMSFSLIIFCNIIGCSSTPKPAEPVQWPVDILTSVDVNPNDYNRPSPIVIIFYQLADDNVFLNADFFALYNDDKKVLNTDLLSRKQLELLPAQNVELQWALNAQTKFIGVIAAYNKLEQSVWRAVYPVDQIALAEKNSFWSLFSTKDKPLEIHFMANKIQ